jgi:hypothetical protein
LPATPPAAKPPVSSVAGTNPPPKAQEVPRETTPEIPASAAAVSPAFPSLAPPASTDGLLFRIQLAGPGLNTQLDVVDADDLALVRALLDKIERRLRQ